MAVSEIVSTGCVHAKSRQSCPTFCDPMDYSPTGSSVHVDSPGKNTGVGLPWPPPGDLPNSGMEPRSTTLQGHSLLSHQGGPKLEIRNGEF